MIVRCQRLWCHDGGASRCPFYGVGRLGLVVLSLTPDGIWYFGRKSLVAKGVKKAMRADCNAMGSMRQQQTYSVWLA
jgi:hypothetical protein